MATNDLTIQPTFAKPASPIDLAPNQTITVVISADRVFDAFGVQSDCLGDPLLCDAAYVFRCKV